MSSEIDSDRAPGGLELVRAFVNTLDVETGAEQLDGPAALGDWLSRAGLAMPEPGPEDLARAIRLREALRALLLANNGEALDPAALAELREAARTGLVTVDFDPAGRARLDPAGAGVDALAARVLGAVAEAQASGSWSRLKVCPAHDCRYAFYDRSRNRSRLWCSMEECGNRAKTRSYRARRGASG